MCKARKCGVGALGGTVTTALLLAASAAWAQAEELPPRDRLYKHACYTGVAMAQSVLPKVANEDELMTRGFSSCDGSLTRLKKTGELDKESDIKVFACGYGIGATFAKYGLGSEVEKGSERVKKAQDRCLAELAKQGIK